MITNRVRAATGDQSDPMPPPPRLALAGAPIPR